ncbi:hypothetical protein P4479_22150 [Brevibacillus agri]|uniref:hypothetical protein n=1 Tax=Brevibacillus agri TaxID=51101 RepID=UPI002E24419A|nr:hypothetical protein [Brevibacillus agri]
MAAYGSQGRPRAERIRRDVRGVAVARPSVRQLRLPRALRAERIRRDARGVAVARPSVRQLRLPRAGPVPSESGETFAALQSRVRASVSYGSHGRPVPSKSARCLLRLRL